MYNRYYPYIYNRSNKLPVPPPPPPKPHPKPPPPKKKHNLKTLKKDTCNSLKDVEFFLNNFSQTWKYIKLINLLK